MAAKGTGPLANLNEAQTLCLIELLNSHSELWDSRLPKYRNKHFKNSLWTSLKLSFEASMNIECTVEHLQAKFASLRNMFARELRKKNQTKISGAGTEDLYRSTWPYFQHLQFLLPVMSITKPTVTNLDTDTPVAEGEMVTEEDQNEAQIHTNSEGVGNTSIEWEDGNAMAETAETPEQNFVKSNKKRKRNASGDLTDCVLQYFQKKKQEDNRDVMSFNNADHVWAMHLVHGISKISNESQRELLKIEMKELLQKYQRAQLMSQSNSNM